MEAQVGDFEEAASLEDIDQTGRIVELMITLAYHARAFESPDGVVVDDVPTDVIEYAAVELSLGLVAVVMLVNSCLLPRNTGRISEIRSRVALSRDFPYLDRQSQR